MVYYKMIYLPDEMMMHIFGFVEDKTELSMTCKLFDKLLLDMYKTGNLSNDNDSYYLKHYTKSNHVKYYNFPLSKIHNKNCLNFVMHYSLDKEYSIYFVSELLRQICKTKNNCRHDYIALLSCKITSFMCKSIMELFKDAINNKSFYLLKIVVSNSLNVKNGFARCFIEMFENRINMDVDNIITTMRIIVSHDIITYKELFDQFYKVKEMILGNSQFTRCYPNMLKNCENVIVYFHTSKIHL
jgi:hypothetical protein